MKLPIIVALLIVFGVLAPHIGVPILAALLAFKLGRRWGWTAGIVYANVLLAQQQDEDTPTDVEVHVHGDGNEVADRIALKVRPPIV